MDENMKEETGAKALTIDELYDYYGKLEELACDIESKSTKGYISEEDKKNYKTICSYRDRIRDIISQMNKVEILKSIQQCKKDEPATKSDEQYNQMLELYARSTIQVLKILDIKKEKIEKEQEKKIENAYIESLEKQTESSTGEAVEETHISENYEDLLFDNSNIEEAKISGDNEMLQESELFLEDTKIRESEQYDLATESDKLEEQEDIYNLFEKEDKSQKINEASNNKKSIEETLEEEIFGDAEPKNAKYLGEANAFKKVFSEYISMQEKVYSSNENDNHTKKESIGKRISKFSRNILNEAKKNIFKSNELYISQSLTKMKTGFLAKISAFLDKINPKRVSTRIESENKRKLNLLKWKIGSALEKSKSKSRNRKEFFKKVFENAKSRLGENKDGKSKTRRRVIGASMLASLAFLGISIGVNSKVGESKFDNAESIEILSEDDNSDISFDEIEKVSDLSKISSKNFEKELKNSDIEIDNEKIEETIKQEDAIECGVEFVMDSTQNLEYEQASKVLMFWIDVETSNDTTQEKCEKMGSFVNNNPYGMTREEVLEIINAARYGDGANQITGMGKIAAEKQNTQEKIDDDLER